MLETRQVPSFEADDAVAIKRFYDDNGFVIVENVFAPSELAPLLERIQEIVEDPSRAPEGVIVSREGDTAANKNGSNDATAKSVRGMAFMARYDEQFRQAAQQPKLLEVVRNLVGPRIKVFRDQMLLKPPGGQDKPPHQDQSYFRVQPVDALVTAWIALNEATLENGCMAYVPGSHKSGRIFEVDLDPERPTHHIPRSEGITLEEEVMCPVPPGAVILHHGLTLHRSGVNNTDTWRRALIFHFATSESKSENETLNQQITLEIG